MAARLFSNGSLSKDKMGMRMRRGSEADKWYQSGARAATDDVKDQGLDIMDRMGGLTLSIGALSQNRVARYLAAFITDESTASGFALVGALETRIGSSQERMIREKSQIPKPKSKKNRGRNTLPTSNIDPEAAPKTTKYEFLERKNFFVAKKGIFNGTFKISVPRNACSFIQPRLSASDTQ
jgi:hypothetical protein